MGEQNENLHISKLVTFMKFRNEFYEGTIRLDLTKAGPFKVRAQTKEIGTHFIYVRV